MDVISGFCDFSIDYEELTEEELEKQSAEKILKIKEKILGKDYSSND